MAQVSALIDGALAVDAMEARQRITTIRLAQAGTAEEIDAWLAPAERSVSDDDDGDDDGAALAAALAGFGLKEVP